MEQITITMDNDQLAALDKMATEKGLNREEVVKRALYRMAILEKAGPELYAELVPGLNDIEAGRFASDEEVEAVFRKYDAR